MSTPVIDISDVSKRFVIRKEKSLKERLVNFGRSNLHKDDFWALRDVNVTIGSGTTVGLIGPNGSGKSTLLKLIGGIIQPNTGSVQLRGRLAALLELGAGFHPDLTGRENVYLNAAILGISRAQTDRYFDAIVDFSGIEPFIDTQVKFYSSGMYVRLAFSVAVHVDPDILLVDEVLAVGDEPFQRKCMERIRGFQHEGRTIVLVTHSLDQVAELCDRALVLERGRVVADGEPQQALRVLRADFESTRQNEIERAQARATATAAGALPAGRIGWAAVVDDRTGEQVTEVRTGDSIRVRVQVEPEGSLSDWVLGVGLQTAMGTTVFGTNTQLLDVETPRLDGPAMFDFRLPDINLGEGLYTVRADLVGRDGHEIHRVLEATSLQVQGDGRSQGPLAVDSTFQRA
ncbi:MAG: ABC transporter ATP-binding protein [Cellulomonas sp. 73-145]|uniref:ABC transporter ATP-binding protein n=1 Tax=Cellulomonas sp. 73-145 TaxID=1895739 RepID=UPI00092BD18C|nr:ABC transporter ATP-binding protein [Cellulomonas sp. 73-145]OJV59757.1 MAG: ABC transporter ATP-binding protein [Cellulomonas sp. 73-145]